MDISKNSDVMKLFYSSIGKSEENFRFCANFEENNNELNLIVLENNNAWSIKISQVDIIRNAEKYGTNFKEYFPTLKKYFNEKPEHVKFEVKAGKFTVSEKLENQMKMVFFQAALNHKGVFADLVYNLLDKFANSNEKLHKEVDSVKQEYETLKTDYKTVEKKLDEFLDRKKSEEEILYNNFIGILNEKKRHIQHLNELLIAFRQGRSCTSVNPPSPKKLKKTTKKLEKPHVSQSASTQNDSFADSDSNNEDVDYNTDGEENIKSMKTATSVVTNENSVEKVKSLTAVSPAAIPGPSKDEENDLDFLYPDLPPLTLPPRRVISATKTEDKVETQKNGNKSSYVAKVNVKDIKDEAESEKEEDSSSSNIPKPNYNTQDLLDYL